MRIRLIRENWKEFAMKRRRLATLLLVPLAAMAVVFNAGAAAPTGVDENGQPTTTVTVDQCGKAQADRTGAWFCVDVAKSRALMQQHIAARANGAPVPTTSTVKVEQTRATTKLAPTSPNIVESTTGDGVAGWCNVSGCWYLWNETPFRHSEFDGAGSYGYGSTYLGDVTVYILDILTSSTQVKVNNQHKYSSRSSKSNSWYDVLYLVNGTYPSGTPCGSSYTQASVNSSAGGTVTWDGVYLSQCIYSTQAVFHRIYWRDWSYPGRWYFFAKSAKYTHQLGYQSYFQGSVDTPSGPLNPAGAGWQNV